MKTVKFIPKACIESTDDAGVVTHATFKGCITLKVPNYFERQKLRSVLMGAISRGGETDVEALKDSAKNADLASVMQKMAAIVEMSVPFYQAVELENIKTGVFHKTFEELSLDADADAILIEVAQELAGGLTLSKNS
jgi:hypothetical protein